MKKKIKIKKTMTINDVLNIDENLAAILMGFGLHCFGCPMSRMESLEEAAMVHNVDVDIMVEKLNEELGKAEKSIKEEKKLNKKAEKEKKDSLKKKK